MIKPQRTIIEVAPGIGLAFDWTRLDIAILVVDLSEELGGRSVTNGSEEVIRHLKPTVPVYYKDTMGNWDEIQHKGGEFTGFASLSASLRESCDRAWRDATDHGEEVQRL